ncbi:MAG TPA: HYR domain-containing protein [Blastocatellia bacterium]|nr:HYR domain-containing protein [Blastocatellia bacterium]
MNTNNSLLKSAFLLVAILGSSILLYKASASADKAKSNPPIRLAQLSDSVSIHSNTRVTPSISVSNGRDLITDYEGTERACAALQNNLASPAALASADFDEDGVPDLICAYRAPDGGIIALHRGNQDAVYPNTSQAQRRKAEGQFTDAPFLSAAKVFELPQAPDFVGAGDFDANGHQDLIIASRGSNTLFILEGDGKANFGATKRIELPGAVTALATGEVNRADGLEDIVVGILAADGPKALVYESPEGASRAIPEAFNLSAEATVLALGRLDDDYLMDFAVAAGKEALVVYGKDDKEKQARVRQRRFASAVRSIAMGSFIDKDRPSLAVLTGDGALHLLGQSEAKKKNQKKSDQINKWKDQSLAINSHSTELVRARLSCAQTDSLVAIDSTARQMQIIADDPYVQNQSKANSAIASRKVAAFDVEGIPVAALPIRLNRSALDNLVILRSGQTSPSVMTPQVEMTFTVITTSPVGAGSLAEAINNANTNPGLDNIVFNVGAGPITINLNGALPSIADPTVIDGTTQPGFTGNPIVELNATNPSNGLSITAGGTTVRGFVINRFGGFGISCGASNNNLIQTNFIGTDLSGAAVSGTNGVGIFIQDGDNNTIGGANVNARNIISGTGNAIQFNGTGINVQNNFIGTDLTGGVELGNSLGFNGVGNNITIRSNIISGNTSGGILIFLSSGSIIQSNLIGTDISGTLNFGNGEEGIDIEESQGTLIGGTAPEAGNVISGSAQEGVEIFGGSTGNLLQGNLIGTNSSGTNAIPNVLAGVFINGANGNTIGGTIAAARNVISNNVDRGVTIIGNGNSVQGNFIGTDASGTGILGNKLGGMLIVGSNNLVGGAAAGARNIISGNNPDGVQIAGAGSSNNVIQGNFIGTDVSGTADLGNGRVGVLISLAATNNTVGGTSDAARNVISGNEDIGIQIANGGTSNNMVQGNFIGTDASGTFALGNSSDGVEINFGASGNTIGGLASNAGNVIAFNGANGAEVVSGTGNSILSNSIFSNSLLGIDLGGDGATPNDGGDADAGANNLQNFPQLISATVFLSSTIIQGTFNGAPNTTFTLQFFSNADCDDSGFGEGKQLIGTRTIQTDAGGNATISFSFPGAFSLPVTMTATDPSGNTSEFSKCAPDITGLDLAISKTASPGVVKPGDTLTYKITAINNGPTLISNVTVLDSLPNSVSFVSCSATGSGVCLGSGNDRSVTFAALPAGTSATITFVATVKTPLPNGTLISNTATINSSAPEDNSANNTATVTVIVSDAPPAIICPGNIIRNADAGKCLAVVEYPVPTVNDTLLGAVIICLPPSGSTFPAGVTTVNCVASNEKGQTGNCAFTITVNSPASARVTLENNVTSLSFGPAEASRKTKKPPKNCDCDSTFTIENIGCATINLALDSIMRTGSDVTNGKITNPDDSKLFSVKLINNQSETDLGVGAVVSIPTGQSRSFRVLFKPGIPVSTGKTTGLAAADVLPDVITSKITFKQNGIEPIVVNLIGRVSGDVRLIDPDDARQPKRVVFTKSGNEFTVIIGIFDADLNVNLARFEFLDGNGQLVEQAFDVDLTQPISQSNIIKGQSFVVTQKFTGAASHSEVASVRVRVSDPRSSDTVTAQLAASAASAQSLQNSARRVVVLPVRRFESLP